MAVLLHSSFQFSVHTKYGDGEGRIILVWSNGLPVEHIRPRWKQHNILKTASEIITEKAKGILLIGGGFNCVTSNRLDKNPPSLATLSGASQALKAMTEDLGLNDTWRHQEKEILHFIHTHTPRTFSLSLKMNPIE